MQLNKYLKQFRQAVGKFESYGYALFQLIKENEGFRNSWTERGKGIL